MSGNYLFWIGLAGAVAVTLIFKGYIRLPSFSLPSPAPRSPDVSWVARDLATARSNLGLDDLTSHEIGVLFAQKKKAEAEEELAHLFAKQAGDTLKATYQAPFSPPAPAGQDQAQPADQPPPA